MRKHAMYAPRIWAIMYLGICWISYSCVKRIIGTYRTAFSFGNPLKTTRVIVMHGLKWPPDVPAHIAIAKRMPNAYARPTWNIAGGNSVREKLIAPASKDWLDRPGNLMMFPTTQITCDPTPISWVSLPFWRCTTSMTSPKKTYMNTPS